MVRLVISSCVVATFVLGVTLPNVHFLLKAILMLPACILIVNAVEKLFSDA